MRQAIVGFGVAVAGAVALAAQAPAAPGVTLAELSWQEAEKVLTPSSVVVLPLGVATVQHGPHLKLNNNERLARYLAARVQAAVSVVYPGAVPLTALPSVFHPSGRGTVLVGLLTPVPFAAPFAAATKS